jgi:hypothetical protein
MSRDAGAKGLKPLCFKRQFPIPRVPFTTLEDFADQYVKTNRPVVLTQVLQDDWSFGLLKERFGQDSLQFMGSYTGYGDQRLPAEDDCTVSEFVDRMLQPGSVPRYTQIRQQSGNITEKVVKALSLEQRIPSSGSAFFWISNSAGSIGLHQDPGSNNTLVQLVGRKHFVLVEPRFLSQLYVASYYGPMQDGFQYESFRSMATMDRTIDEVDLAKFPRLADAEAWCGVLEPGEVLFIPTSWFHCLTNLTPVVNVTYRNKNKARMREQLSFVAHLHLLLDYLARLPPEVRQEYTARALFELELGHFTREKFFDGPVAPPGLNGFTELQGMLSGLISQYTDKQYERELGLVPAQMVSLVLLRMGLGDHAQEFERIWDDMQADLAHF